MDGAARRARRAYELALFGAWQSARFATFTDKLKPFAHYAAELKAKEPTPRQSPADMLTAMRRIKARMEPR